jgi:hypothetical protein
MAEGPTGGANAEDAWQGEPASLFASTAPFCDAVLDWARVDGVSLALLAPSPNSRELVFATDALAQRIDELQFALGEGPCIASYVRGRTMCVTNVAADDRWTAFAREAAALGVGAVYSFPVRIGSHPVGVLELYRRRTGALTLDEYDAALGCAAAIGAVIGSTYARWSQSISDTDEIDEGMLRAMTESDPFTRSDVHVAGGYLAEKLGVSVGEALLRLRAYAFAREMRVTDVADDILCHRIPWTEWADEPSTEN